MKVLMCNKFYRPVGGPETIFFDSMKELISRGHTVAPFAMEHPDNVASEYADYFVPNLDYGSQHGKGALQLAREACGMVYSSEARRRIGRLIAEFKPDIAHAHNVYHQLSPAILSALREAGVPTVLTLHDGKLVCPNMLFLTHGRVCDKCGGSKFYHAVLNKCVKDSAASSMVCCIEGTLHRWSKIYERNVDLFITPSRFLKNKMVEHGRLKEDAIAVLPNYARTESVFPNFSPGDYGLYAGWLEPHKGIRTLLEACKELPDFEMRLAGRGSLADEGARFAEREGLVRLKFVGFQTGDDLTRLFRESRFLVLPSECYENCPMVILEAFSAGKPVIAARVGGIPELIEEGVDGLLFEPGDVSGLASCMRKFAENPALCEEMGRAGRLKAEQQYSFDKYMDRLLEIYSGFL